MKLQIDRRKVTVREVLNEAKMNGISSRNIHGMIFEFTCKENPMKVVALKQVFGLKEITSSQETDRKLYRYICVEDAPKTSHIHETMVKRNYDYLISKDDDDRYCKVTGVLFNSLGGHIHVIEKSILIEDIKPYVKRIK